MTRAPSQSSTVRPAGEIDVAARDAARDLVLLLNRALTTGERCDEAAYAWLHAGAQTLNLRGGGVEIDGVECGVAGDRLGEWPKVLSDAGVRNLRPRHTLSGDALAIFGNALRTSGPEQIIALRGWLWGGAPFGVRCELGPALWQTPARIGYGVPDRAALNKARSATVARARLTDAQPWPEAAALLTHLPSDGARQSLQRSADDATRWVEDTVAAFTPPPPHGQGTAGEDGEYDDGAAASAVGSSANHEVGGPSLGDEGLAPLAPLPLPDMRHAAGVTEVQIAFAPSLGLATLWDDLPDRDQAFAAALRERLPAATVGKIVGRTMPIDGHKVEQIDTLLSAGTDFASGLAGGLLMRAVDPRSVEGVCALLQRLGLQRVWPIANLSGISAQGARGLALVLKRLDAGASQWADLVGAAPPQVAAWILKGAPPHILSRVGGQLRIKLVNQPPHETAPLVEALVAMDAPTPLRAVGEALRETRGKGWSGRLVPAVCHALIRHKLGEELLVPLFFDAEAETPLRLLVLRSLEDDPALLALVTKFRLGELREPKQIQARLKAARKKLKGGR